jgi:hypothetical protein
VLVDLEMLYVHVGPELGTALGEVAHSTDYPCHPTVGIAKKRPPK